ncbi:unnamed protein product [Acanthosepion pharaonis]|uniref:VWFA domain-containing protein n=1 Tax=Acanthosepion pharaonis TaxID=158019 RepID=A0A812DJ70_ACAPH|nr:unnamed protein product [Sepia pharaonis]
MGAYRAHIIQQFINYLLPYTGYGHFGVVSYAYCPENFNVPVTSLMDKEPSDIGSNVTIDIKLPTLADVVSEMRKELNERAVENTKKGLVGNQIAVLFVDPSVTAITSDLMREAGKLKQDGSKLYLISVGESASHQSQYLHSLSSQPFKKYILSYPTYDQLLTSVKDNPSQFSTIATKSLPAN